MISESISNVRANGVAFDAGIRYLAGDDGRLKFGISLRNVGLPCATAVMASPDRHPSRVLPKV